MKKIFLKNTFFLFFVFSLFYFFVFKTNAIAANRCENQFADPNPVDLSYSKNSTIEYFFVLDDSADHNAKYVVKADNGTFADYSDNFTPLLSTDPALPSNKYIIRGKFNINYWGRQFTLDFNNGRHVLNLYRLIDQQNTNSPTIPYCSPIYYDVLPEPAPTLTPATCTLTPSTKIPTIKDDISISIEVTDSPPIPPNEILTTGHAGTIIVTDLNSKEKLRTFTNKYVWDRKSNFNGSYRLGAFPEPIDVNITFDMWKERQNVFNEGSEGSCSIILKIGENTGSVINVSPTPEPTIPAICNDKSVRDQKPKPCNPPYDECPWCPKVKRQKLGIDIPKLKPLCDQLGGEFSGKCWECQKTGGIWSAIGCLPTDFSALIKKYVFTTGVGLAGGIAFLYFLYGAFMILTSTGNAEKIEEAKQIITSSLAGLLLIIFSVFLLKTIGVDILQLPGFG